MTAATLENVIAPALPSNRRWLNRFSIFLVGCVLLLIFMGGLVKSHEAGLAVPDWPTSYGQNMFLFPPDLWIGPIWYEHVHRLIASVVGLLTVILAFWIAAVDDRRSLKHLGIAAVVLVMIQGGLGGLTVLMKLPPAVSATHGVIAQTFLMLLVLIAYLLHTERDSETASRTINIVSAITVGAIYAQLIIGAVMRHNAAGLAIPDFPTMGGALVPTFSSEWFSELQKLRGEVGLVAVSMFQVWIHIAHRTVGFIILGLVLILARLTLRESTVYQPLRGLAYLALGLVIVQLLLGIATILTVRSPTVASLHVVCGAGLLAVVWWYYLNARGARI